MKKVDLNNYEAYIVDYYDGKLNAEEASMLKSFLLLHPELDVFLEEDWIIVPADEEKKCPFDVLKAEFDEEFVFGYVEGMLSEKEIVQAQLLEKNNKLFQLAVKDFQKTILVPDSTIVFEEKHKLYKTGRILVLPSRNFLKVAAVIFLPVMITLLLVALYSKREEPLTNYLSDNPASLSHNKKSIAILKNEGNTHDKSIQLKNNQTFDKKNTSVITNNSIKENLSFDGGDSLSQLSNEPDNITSMPYNSLVSDSAIAASPLVQQMSTESKGVFFIEEADIEDIHEVSITPSNKNMLWNIAAKGLSILNKGGWHKVSASNDNRTLYIGGVSISKAQ